MGFMEAVQAVLLRRYADFQGRSRRAEYWYFTLFNVILNFVFALIVQAVGDWFNFVTMIIGLALIIPSIAVTIRRFHDIDMSGWWILTLLIPLVNIVLILVWFTRKGTDGDNRFGPDPLGSPVEAFN